jgi:hypothetical protein
MGTRLGIFEGNIINGEVIYMFKLNQDRFLQEINNKWANKNCPMCSKNNWNIDPNMVTALRLTENGGVSLGGNMIPLVAVTCLNCGNVVFVNPLVINAVDKDDKE